MPERQENKEREKPTDLLVIAPATLDIFIVVVTGNSLSDTPSLKPVRSANIFTDDLVNEVSEGLRLRKRSSMGGFLNNARQLINYGALTRIADDEFGKGLWQGKKTIRMVLADSFQSFMDIEGHNGSRKIISDAGLDDELHKVVDDLKTEALIVGTEYEDIVWQNPNSVPKQ